MNFRIEELNDTNIKLWEKFNHEMDEGTFFHTTKWKQILESLGNIPHYFLIFDDDEPVAICPFFETRIKGFKGITTLPLSDSNHIIVRDNNSSIINFIRKELELRAKKKSWSFIIFNFLDKNFENKVNTTFFPNHSIGTMVLDIEKLNPDRIWNEIFTKKGKERTYINRFKREGFQIRDIKSLEDLKIFYRYYIKNIRHINGIEYPFSHFMDLYELYFPKNLHMNLLYKEDFIAGGSINFLDESKKTFHSRYLAFNRDMPLRYRVPHALIWEAIKKADKMGFKTVSLGSTVNDKNHPNYRLKKHFGSNYENVYSILIPTSKLFKLGHKIYTSIK